MFSFAPVISRKYFKLECLEGGQWEETNCEPISCPALPDVFQGMHTCTNGLYYDTLCSLQCPDATENVRFQQLSIFPPRSNRSILVTSLSTQSCDHQVNFTSVGQEETFESSVLDVINLGHDLVKKKQKSKRR